MKLSQIEEGKLKVSKYIALCPWCAQVFVKSPPHKKFCSEKCKSKFNFQKRYQHKRPIKLKGPDLFAA